MNTAGPNISSSGTGAWLDENFPLHKAVFENKILHLTTVLNDIKISGLDINQKDTHGNTALHLAAMLGDLEAAKLLLENGAIVGIKNNDGWKSLHEAISFGDRKLIGLLLSAHKRQSHRSLSSRLPDVVKHMAEVGDFYMEIRWEFQTWVPLLSRVMPQDKFKVYKSGSKVRVDFTLIDFNEHMFGWTRGNMSTIFDPSAPKGYQTFLVNNREEIYHRLCDKDQHLNDEVDFIMSSDITSSHISMRPIQFVRSRNWLLGKKSHNIGEYKAELFHIKGMAVITRKRREHLSQDDVRKNRAMQKAFCEGKIPRDADKVEQHRVSLSPPPKYKYSWPEYLRLSDGPEAYLGRTKEEKSSQKEIRGMVALCQDFPLSTEHLLELLEVLEPVKPTVKRFRSFCSSGKLPPGFPIQLEIPVLAAMTMKITVQLFQWKTLPEEMFKVPSHFREGPSGFNHL